MDKKKLSTGIKLRGDMIAVAFASLKEVLPSIARYNKVKTDNNDIILGKWQAKR
jgi:hypothetical protein